jgi:hypothetical protein
MKNRFTSVLASALAVALVIACQSYDFDRVDPFALGSKTFDVPVVARGLKPNVMLLVDKSLSMNLPVDPSLAACRLGDGGTCGARPVPDEACPLPDCPTRISELHTAMDGFLPTNGALARMGLTLFPEPQPGDQGCGAPADVRRDIVQVGDGDTAGLQAAATAINDILQNVESFGAVEATGGGTPTGASIRMVGAKPSMAATDRENIILLLTDGAPNCNAQWHGGAYDSSCQCTLPNTALCASGPYVPGCLDDEATIAEIQALANRTPAAKTIVIGFGAETASGAAYDTLNGMAQAGGYPRRCVSGACGAGDTCGGDGFCQRKYYQAANGAQLAQVLQEIGGILNAEPCLVGLSFAPSNPDLMSVFLDGVRRPRSDGWSYSVDATGQARVTFTGSLCAQLEASTAADPVDVQVRIVEPL